MKSTPFISIIIPAYNEESRLLDSLEKIARFLETQDYQSEVLIVENGSSDRTFEIANDFSKEHPNFRAISEAQSGKI